ncbi:hypothetical protein [Amycolatopsis sp. NBC_01480]|uniref:hypothetical protein n=1 Tax=Amycolatopsis sp. NBC_01480 TaxID=2903562 RepID=UPI002E2D30DA|nr:hypothetical protein [Amycolatopsis sp. NBC_01480]
MNGWAVCALVVIGAPLLLLLRWVVSDWRRARRRQRFRARQQPDWSVAAIVARVEQQRADEAAVWPTEDPEVTDVLPAVPVNEQPTTVTPITRLPVRKRPYVERRPSPYPRQRTPLQAPDTEIMRQVLDGLRRFDER